MMKILGLSVCIASALAASALAAPPPAKSKLPALQTQPMPLASPAPAAPSPTPLSAPEMRLRQKGFHLEPYLATGATRFGDTTGSQHAPFMVHYNVGLTGGVPMGKWMVCATFDWQYYGQLSSIENGNFTGSRFNILAPTAAFYYKSILVKTDLQILGNYQFKLTNLASEDVELTKPIGLRITLNYPQMLGFRFLGADLRFFTAFQLLTYGGVKTTGGDASSLGTRTKILSLFLGFSYIY